MPEPLEIAPRSLPLETRVRERVASEHLRSDRSEAIATSYVPADEWADPERTVRKAIAELTVDEGAP